MKLSADTLIELNENGCHYITDSQIDAAWKFYTDECNESLMGYMSNKFVFENVVAHFGIERCSCRGGIYTEGNDDGSQTVDLPCQLCNGHGWVKIGGGDD